jgi:hypothetical protein
MGDFFGSKPSDAHVVWEGRGDRTRFDFEYLELWAAHFGVDYEQWERVDHERGSEPRAQHVCVFARTEGEGTETTLDGETWTMGTPEQPRTFLEIDETGMARVRGWTSERIIEVTELVVDGRTLKLRTAEGTTMSLETGKLTSRPQREPA